MAKKFTINDTDREEWVLNDSILYHAQRRSRLPMRKFIRENRAEIDAVIHEANKPRESGYHLGYMQQRGAA